MDPMGKGRFLDKLKALEGAGRFSLDFFLQFTEDSASCHLEINNYTEQIHPVFFPGKIRVKDFPWMIPRMHPSGHPKVFDSPGFFEVRCKMFRKCSLMFGKKLLEFRGPSTLGRNQKNRVGDIFFWGEGFVV